MIVRQSSLYQHITLTLTTHQDSNINRGATFTATRLIDLCHKPYVQRSQSWPRRLISCFLSYSLCYYNMNESKNRGRYNSLSRWTTRLVALGANQHVSRILEIVRLLVTNYLSGQVLLYRLVKARRERRNLERA